MIPNYGTTSQFAMAEWTIAGSHGGPTSMTVWELWSSGREFVSAPAPLSRQERRAIEKKAHRARLEERVAIERKSRQAKPSATAPSVAPRIWPASLRHFQRHPRGLSRQPTSRAL